MRRKEDNEAIKDQLSSQIQDQKIKIKKMIRSETEKYEHSITDNIMKDPNRSRRIWFHINNLKDRQNTNRKSIELVDDSGKKIPDENVKDALIQTWTPLYQSKPNDINEVWNTEEMERYMECRNSSDLVLHSYEAGVENVNGIFRIRYEQIYFPDLIREHMDYAFYLTERAIQEMPLPNINAREVINQIKAFKVGKAPGPDGIKPEIIKLLLEEQNIISVMTSLLNQALRNGTVPDSWRVSNTILIEKVKKPTTKDLRPIALTNILYKLFMGIIKKRIEEHLQRNYIAKDTQSGATIGRRVTDNIFILQYCIERSFIDHQKLYVVAIDFSKAFDSVDRKMMIDVLKMYKIHGNVINIISKIYQGDKTDLIFNKQNCGSIEVTSGIRQGCNVSALLFVIVTYKIIEEMERSRLGYRDNDFYLPLLFYMDDALLLARKREDAVSMVNIFERTAMKFGLKLNRKKCQMIVFNSKDQEREINGIKTAENMKYLGIDICKQRRWYKNQVENMKTKGNKLSNVLFSVLGCCCNRMIIGKTFWKGLAIPNMMYGQEIIPLTKTDLSQLEVIENKAYRTILQLPKYTPVEFLRGEIGATSVQMRDVKSKLLHLQYTLKDRTNELVRNVALKQLEDERMNWSKSILKCLSLLGVTKEYISIASRDEIVRRVKELDKSIWIESMSSKVSISIYQKYKDNINEVKWVRNEKKWNIMLKARSNTLELGWRNWGVSEEKECKMCHATEESLTHFLIKCPELQTIRNKYIEFQWPLQEDEDELVSKILILGSPENKEEYFVDILFEMWCNRAEKLHQ